MAPSRRNKESGLIQVSLWLREADVDALREIGKRPEVDREWSWLVRKAMQEYIERDQQQRMQQGEAK
jgi:translation elongation factor EF-4